MSNLEKYLKYYFLEEYLFKEVHNNFQKHGFLTPEELFAIVIWKSNRAKTKFKNESRGVVNSKTIRDVTERLDKLARNTSKNELEMLDSIMSLSGIGIPMASAILTVCYPDYFTLVDYRAKSSLVKFLNNEVKVMRGEIKSNLKNLFGADPQNSPKAYLKYCKRCRDEADNIKVSLRNFDRMLFGKDFYEGEGGLKQLVEELK